MLMAMGIPVIAYGIIYHEALWGKLAIAAGAIIALSALIGWGMEPLEEPMEPHEEELDHAPAGAADVIDDGDAGGEEQSGD
jgi:hypothetical protein